MVSRTCLGTAIALLVLSVINPLLAEPVKRECLKDAFGESRAFSRAIVTEGGRTVWLAGVAVREDKDGNSLAGDLQGQAHRIFEIIGERLALYGGTLEDIVTMTVFISDARFGTPFVDIRKGKFTKCYPSSALITVTGFAHPDILLEIKATAVVGD